MKKIVGIAAGAAVVFSCFALLTGGDVYTSMDRIAPGRPLAVASCLEDELTARGYEADFQGTPAGEIFGFANKEDGAATDWIDFDLTPVSQGTRVQAQAGRTEAEVIRPRATTADALTRAVERCTR